MNMATELTVVGMMTAVGWRYVRQDATVTEGTVLTRQVDAFLVTADGRLLPVAYEPGRGTVYLEEEPGVTLLQTGAARVPADGAV